MNIIFQNKQLINIHECGQQEEQDQTFSNELILPHESLPVFVVFVRLEIQFKPLLGRNEWWGDGASTPSHLQVFDMIHVDGEHVNVVEEAANSHNIVNN